VRAHQLRESSTITSASGLIARSSVSVVNDNNKKVSYTADRKCASNMALSHGGGAKRHFNLKPFRR